MKTLTVRELYCNAALAEARAEGRKLIVAANRKPNFVVSKAAMRRMTRKLAEARAVGDPKCSRFDGTAFLVSLKK